MVTYDLHTVIAYYKIQRNINKHYREITWLNKMASRKLYPKQFQKTYLIRKVQNQMIKLLSPRKYSLFFPKIRLKYHDSHQQSSFTIHL